MWTYTVSGPQEISERRLPAPAEDDLRDGELLVKVLAGGICGSDLPFFRGMVMPYGLLTRAGDARVPPPGSPMHEVVGQVVASHDSSIEAGARVVGWATGNNAMCEYVVVSGTDVHPFSETLEPTVAVMLQPLACVIYAVSRLQDIAGRRATVIGQGPIGVLFSHVLKTQGAAHVTGVDRIDRSDVAETFGVDEPIWSSSDRWAIAARATGRRPEIIIEAIGHQVSTLVDATSVLADSGQIYYFGIPDDPIYPFPMDEFVRVRGRLYAGNTPDAARRDSLRRADQYLAAHQEIIEPYITRAYPFARAQEAFAAANAPKRGQLKIALEA